MIITLMGAPGSGKGTQGRSLASSLGVPYLASGDLIRRAMADRSRWGEQVRSFIERGLYVPDEDIVPVFLQALIASNPHARRIGGVLDGFPRTTEQALALDRALSELSPAAEQLALVLDVPEDVLIARLSGRWLCGGCNASYNVQSHPPIMVGVCDSCGRALMQRVDDRRDTIQERLLVYAASTRPVIDFYTARGSLRHVNGDEAELKVREGLLIAVGRAVPVSR
ncbi:MAG: nucleoside monophosphate kinase [Chloroflexi bacterium]|nr:nucleoside monophosphate kinase [Chloroflexota bacterium]